MRVVFLVTDLELGGTPLRLARTAEQLRSAGVDVHVGCLAHPGPVSHRLSQTGIPTFACDARHALDLRAIWMLRRNIERIQPDVIHATLFHANVAARLIGPCLGIPIVGSTATIEVERRWHAQLEYLTAPIDAAHIVNSPAVARHVVDRFGLPPSRVHVVPPSLDPFPQIIDKTDARRRFALPPDAFIIAWAGRFDPVKRLPVVLECAQKLEPPALFVLAGAGPEYDEIAGRIAADALLRERVRLLGWQSDLAPLLSAADTFVFPSLTEGMPNAVLEAMACGVPVVASRLPVLEDLADDGNRIVLVNGETADFVTAVMRIRDDTAMREQHAANALAWAREHLRPALTVATLQQIYRNTQQGG